MLLNSERIRFQVYQIAEMNLLLCLSLSLSLWLTSLAIAEPDYSYRSYQQEIYCKASSYIESPTCVSQIQKIVKRAARDGKTVKAFGSRHSVTDIICTQGVPIAMENFNHAKLHSNGMVTFGAGIKLGAAMEFLEGKQRSFSIIPSFLGISLGGAVGTGAHGSSLQHPTALSDLIDSMKVVLGDGTLVTFTSDDEDFDLFRVQLGLLCIIVELTMRTVPLQKMTVENNVHSDSALFDDSIPTMARNSDMFQLWWFPNAQSLVTGTGNFISANSVGDAYTNFIPNSNIISIITARTTFETVQLAGLTSVLEAIANVTELSLYGVSPSKPPIFTEDGSTLKNPATGYAWRLQSNLCTSCSWDFGNNSVYSEESSMAFDLSEFCGVMEIIRDILAEQPAAFPLVGIYIRFAVASNAKMGIAYGRETFTVEWALPMRTDPFGTAKLGLATYQAILQEMVFNYGGRPHWGKNGLYYTTRQVLSVAVPNRQEFVDAMSKYDPNGRFLNHFGERMCGVSDVQDRDPLVTHCALQDYCVCSTDDDCGGSLPDCQAIDGFPVCN